MPSFTQGSNALLRTPPLSLRVGAATAVLILHAAVVGAIFMAPTNTPTMPVGESIWVSVVDAPTPQPAQAPPAEAHFEPPPESRSKPKPELKPEPTPEPVLEKPPLAVPKPKPKPPPKPQATPQTKPSSVLEPKTVSQIPPATAPAGAPVSQPISRSAPPGPPPLLDESSIAYEGQRPMPVYPQASRRLREAGRVVVLVDINVQGWVERAVVEVSSGFPRLDASALAAANKGRFKPYTRNGVAYAAKAKLPFDFVIRD